MRTKVLLGVAVALMLVVSVATIGSNMGFKISIPLKGGAKINWVSIPWYNSYSTASAVFNDVTGCAEVGHWLTDTYAPQIYTSPDDPDFAIAKGEGFYVKVPVDGNWIVVGSHDPGYAVPLKGSTKINWLSIPYHSTASLASVVFSQVPNCAEVGLWLTDTYAPQIYTSPDDPDFTITPGTAYYVKISAGDSSWTPAHY
jgi:hypothetical protein